MHARTYLATALKLSRIVTATPVVLRVVVLRVAVLSMPFSVLPISALIVSTLAVSMQTANAASATQAGYKPPRTLDGKPSLEGTWTNATLTPLQRPSRYKQLVIPADQVQAATDSHPQVVRQKNDDLQDKNTVLNGSDLNSGRGYNAFWIDPGMTFNNVKGEYRASFIVDPENGQIPFKGGARPMRGGAEGEGEGAAPPPPGAAPRRGAFDGPESRPLGERCIINSGSAGPPMLTYLYNNNYEFIQSRDQFLIRAEMNNYARIVRIGGKHPSPKIRMLHGDSIGHWEGDTLVVETTNFHPFHANGMVSLTENAKVIEKFSRYSKTQVLYEFTIEDPERYQKPWRGEYSFNAIKEHVYEYACHEGNYALVGTLAGAREEEKRAAQKGGTK